MSGVALRYGDIAPDYHERFESAAFGPVDRIALNLQHDSNTVITPDAMLTDSPRELRVRADLPEGSAALRLVRRGVLSGFSIEFHAKAERREGGIRVIERAELSGLALVDVGAYPQSVAEVRANRARSGRTMRARVPYAKKVACECIARSGPGSGGACVPYAKFMKLAGDGMAEVVESALAEGRDVLAVMGNYRRPLASASRGTLRARSTDQGLDVEIDLPAGTFGDDVVSAHESSGVVVRPLVDYDRSEFVDTDEGREVTRAFLRAFLVGTTDTKEGWPEPRIDYGDPERAAPWRRRVWL